VRDMAVAAIRHLSPSDHAGDHGDRAAWTQRAPSGVVVDRDTPPGGVRCAHELDEQDVKRLVDLRVRVRGRPEYGPGNDVRLLWVDEVEILE
jgi:hypothetical protein